MQTYKIISESIILEKQNNSQNLSFQIKHTRLDPRGRKCWSRHHCSRRGFLMTGILLWNGILSVSNFGYQRIDGWTLYQLVRLRVWQTLHDQYSGLRFDHWISVLESQQVR